MNYAKAISKYIRISPRKARLAAGLIRGLPVSEASVQLTYSNLKAGRLLKKTLDSAVANAETKDMRRESLKVVEVRVDAGPTLKRAKPKNRGGRHPIMKRTSHFTVIVSNQGV
ncbi:MAG: 50S ribosomal protein L22 [Candidatus Protochlamydia sp.]|jgi:large subunit ribosomal protein L22|nr:50S ribosomal protein L22 [Candidatus Protochlamydia sp.]